MDHVHCGNSKKRIAIKNIFAILLVSVFCNFCYLNSLNGDFAYDDGAAIKKNKDVTKAGPLFETIGEIFTNDFWGQSLSNETSHKSYRPLTTLSFRFNWVSTGEDTYYFHLANTAIHILVTTMVGCLAHTVLEDMPTSSIQPELHLRASIWCEPP
jgi:hypothetical protein